MICQKVYIVKHSQIICNNLAPLHTKTKNLKEHFLNKIIEKKITFLK